MDLALYKKMDPNQGYSMTLIDIVWLSGLMQGSFYSSLFLIWVNFVIALFFLTGCYFYRQYFQKEERDVSRDLAIKHKFIILNVEISDPLPKSNRRRSQRSLCSALFLVGCCVVLVSVNLALQLLPLSCCCSSPVLLLFSDC